ncbi:MAG: MazG nucleotide pyrophosphohydrolase domain-containing protein [Nanoarchaeota archaeon]
MEWDKLIGFVASEHCRLKKHYPSLGSDDDQLLARTVKLSEEVGELSDAVLKNLALQRSEKLQRTSDELSSECADVIICAMLIAQAAGVDVSDALQKKIAHIQARVY